MKKIIIFVFISLFSILSACASNAEIDQLRADLMAAEKSLAESGTQIEELESILENLKNELDITMADKAKLEVEMNSDDDDGILSDIIDAENPDISACILLEGVAYDSPDRNARYTPFLENHYAEVILKATVMHLDGGGSEQWYLVWCGDLNGPSHDIGWVPADEVVEYTEENMSEIVWPVKLCTGAALFVDCNLETAADDFLLSSSFYIRELGEEISVLGTPGDPAWFYVRNADIVYPEP